MTQPSAEQPLDVLHHIALAVDDIQQSVDWYTQNFHCRVVYQDETWALVELANLHLAFVSRDQHPAHIGFVRPDAERFGRLKPHRDGTRSVYVQDPSGNAVEILAENSLSPGP